MWDWSDWMNRFMTPFFGERYLSTGAVAPVDVCERDNSFVVRMACAGCRPEDIEVTVENDMVRIRGKFIDHEMMAQQGQTGGQHMGGQHMGGQQMGGQQMSGQQMGGQQMGGQQGGQWTGQQGGQQGGQWTGQQMAGQQGGQWTGQQGGQWTGQQGAQHEVCLIRELPTGRFERDITLPTPVNAQQTRASFENGLLTLVLPKTEAAMGHRIQIGQAAGAGTR
jgi:HSP20 family molecular chaperone IbpA